jgi:hypothetical protein
MSSLDNLAILASMHAKAAKYLEGMGEGSELRLRRAALAFPLLCDQDSAVKGMGTYRPVPSRGGASGLPLLDPSCMDKTEARRAYAFACLRKYGCLPEHLPSAVIPPTAPDSRDVS